MKLARVTLPEANSTADWCEANIYMSSRMPTSEPGQWSRKNVPALCCKGGILEALDDPEVETVAICKGSQTALTTTAYCWLAKEQANDPASALIVMNSTQDARDKSAETWRPIFEDSHTLKRLLPASRRKDWTKLYQLVNNAPVYWIGANSPGRLASKPIRRLILDEVDKYPSGFGRKGRGTAQRLTSSEAGAVELAEQRTKGYRKKQLAKILKFSTPTDDQGAITQAVLLGDQRRGYVKCPHCGVEQVMVWANFKIDMTLAKKDSRKAVDGAHYECPHCRKGWTDHERWSALAPEKMEFKPTTTPKDPRCRSYYFPSWYSTFVTTAYLAAQWIKAQESQSALQDFINSECGEPFVHYENQIKDSVFFELEGDYEEGELWADLPQYKDQYKDLDRAVIIGCDVQKGYLVPVVYQFVRGGDAGLVWTGDCANFHALDKLAEKFNAQFIMVDQRYRTREVQEWCEQHQGYIPCLGVSMRARSLYTVSNVDLDEGKRGQGRTGRIIETLSHDPDMLKDILAIHIQRGPGSKRFVIPRGYSMKPEYTAEMSAERCINSKWVNPRNKPNHKWDATLLAYLGAIRYGIFPVEGETPEESHDAPDPAESA